MLTRTQHETDIICGDLTARFSKQADQSRVNFQLLPAALAARH